MQNHFQCSLAMRVGYELVGTAILIAFTAVAARAGDDERPAPIKTQHFDVDPQWEGKNNRIELRSVPIVKQDFGLSGTNFAAVTSGEIGGRVTRTSRPAYYALQIERRTLAEPLTAAGTFAIIASQAGAGVFFGWFQSEQPGGSGRPIGSLGLHLDFESQGGRLAVRLITGDNQSCGTFITKYERYKTPEEKQVMRPTPLRNDGKRYHWQLRYDPEGNGGNGRLTFVVASNSAAPEDFEGRTFTVDLPEGYKEQATAFDRFGLMNMMKAGGAATIYFGDLKLNGQSLDLRQAGGWMGHGNQATYEDREQVGAHSFGYSATTNQAGGARGEIGGDFWRSGTYGYYADRVGALSLNDKLEARGKVVLVVGGPDADMQLGWFSSQHGDKSPVEDGDFLGVAVGGPTRVGHYFAPAFTTSRGTRGKVESAPVLKPGKCYEWSLIYDPSAGDGAGEIRVTLGSESVVLPLAPGKRAEGATFDRFGLFTSQAGGQMVRIYFDDLEYIAKP